jgi:hypothetical protein
MLRVAWDLSPIAAHASAIAQAATDAGDEIPEDAIPPEIPDEARFAYFAFNEFATDRQVGMGVGPIPFTAIDAYAHRYGIAGDEFERFRLLIRTIESEQRRATES